MNNWIAYGDVNPLEHGGIWERMDKENQSCFTVVTINRIDGEVNSWLFTETYINMTDGWLDKKNVADFVGSYEQDLKAHDFVNYHGAWNCNGDEVKYGNEEDVIKALSEYGIEI